MEIDKQGNESSSQNNQLPEHGLRREPDKPDLKAAMRFYLGIFALLMFVGSFVQFMHFEIGMIITQIFLILIPAIWFWNRYGVDKVKFARLYPLKLKYVPTILILAIVMWVINMIVAVVMVTGLMEIGYEPITVIEPPETITQYLGYVVVLSVFAGICEEVLFRGAIMPSMESRGLVPAIVFSSLLFALFHVSFLNLFSTFLLGIVMAVLVIKTGSLWSGILYHMANNFIAATYLYIAGQHETATEMNPGALMALFPLLAVAAVAAYFLFRLLHRQTGSRPLLKERKNWLPRGWFSFVFAAALFIFLVMATFELAIGFDWFDLGL
ncbi:MAG: CPBP family glutamic-type intramembrane protease [Bacillota bacterium]